VKENRFSRNTLSRMGGGNQAGRHRRAVGWAGTASWAGRGAEAQWGGRLKKNKWAAAGPASHWKRKEKGKP
jgi:hypothetical protein